MSKTTDTKQLFQTFTFKNGIETKNRIAMAPMTTWASNDDYTISDDELKHYETRSGNVGLVITGCTRVMPNGIGFNNEYASYDDSFLPSLKKLAAAAKKGGAPAILQIYHAGNKAVLDLIPDGIPVSASPVALAPSAFYAGGTVSRELTHEEILEMIKAFGETTHRAIQAGFDGIELHGAHGFLLQNFFSPYYNQRTDYWGGSSEKRMNFAVEVIKETQDVIKKYADRPFLIGFRISPEEPESYSVKDTFPLIDKLIESGIDYLHVSLADLLSQKSINDENGDATLLKSILDHVNQRIPVIAAGGIKQFNDAIEALKMGLSMVAVGHGLIINPNWVELASNEEQADEVLSMSKADELAVPKKLQEFIKVATGFFQVKE
ncbi:NADH-dependent flavin oxidoreductase [Leeuwenhoekiella marinoflava]|uniref:2,4-dienoyl-CoA reductase-like NADH-dependent reductase (Old Yellow Enzyme family) n=2 Tax=Leeuwenhoekiella marinoflava TaxID=988 RepID=A0A4Q0PPC8_9FLAO|nr:NADH-dependent flavin oxidoreductase [Leeuwenhoekiella marinoflava]RXG32321.1 2,4-dienoyl-CoA reductase-like NADH-dependent reductase (Old Yellow Enzyme family) [Leeuwenhoekiella marinoflava]SHE79205.1 2,4-dienoyl-CoA reductase [Leeuwenhoekiella marinoflava DSM 3653]